MNEKLFNFFSKKVGSAKIDGCEYAFCHPLDLEIDEFGELVAACTVVDEEGDFYDLWWSQSGCTYENLGKPVVKRIGKYKELPEKNIQKIKIYLEEDRLLRRIRPD